MSELVDRDGDEPHVDGDADGPVGPGQGVKVDAPALAALELGPKVRQRHALAERDEDKGDAEENVEQPRQEQQPPHRSAGEYGQVEPDHGKLEGKGLEKVEELHGPEPDGEVPERLRRQGPDVSSQPVVHEIDVVDDGGRYAGEPCGEDQPVVGSKSIRGVEPFEDESAPYEDGSEGHQDDGYLQVVDRDRPRRYSADCLCGIFGDWGCLEFSFSAMFQYAYLPSASGIVQLLMTQPSTVDCSVMFVHWHSVSAMLHVEALMAVKRQLSY